MGDKLSADGGCIGALWAKKPRDGSMEWLPLRVHIEDTFSVAKWLWTRWLTDGARARIEAGAGGAESAYRLFLFLAMAHDVGKATPAFQSKCAAYPPCEADEQIKEAIMAAGYPIKNESEFITAKKTPHAIAGQLLLEKAGLNHQAASIVGAHHGRGADMSVLAHGMLPYMSNFNMGQPDGIWDRAQEYAIRIALDAAGFDDIRNVPVPDKQSQVLLCGLLIMADWIASNQELFPYIPLHERDAGIKSEKRARAAMAALSLPMAEVPGCDWMQHDIYETRFGFTGRAMQLAAATAAGSAQEPGIMIIEAPMGSGKTEAALAAVEILGSRTGRPGMFFALPTQATANGIFPRILEWMTSMGGTHSVRLAHAMAQFNDEYRSLFHGSSNVAFDDQTAGFVHPWFEGNKKALLADDVIGTVDQLLMAALKQKHVMLRHLGLAGKVVVVDECHAYDAYMNRYLDTALGWLGAYRVPVLLLSATLPPKRRQELMDAYMGISASKRKSPLSIAAPAVIPEWVGCRAYPVITYSDGKAVKQICVPPDGQGRRRVDIGRIKTEDVPDELEKLLKGGGCAGVIMNTVTGAQDMYRRMCDRFGANNVTLFHSQFMAPDRANRERTLLFELGKPGKASRPELHIVIGTQVLEQSLDIDLDVLFTELCPMDLLLQRMGRLHRHVRPRPKQLLTARCLICQSDDDSGSRAVYGDYLLMQTDALLPNEVMLPDMIPGLVASTYDDELTPDGVPAGYAEAKRKHMAGIDEKYSKAGAYCIERPSGGIKGDLSGWLDVSVAGEKCGEAAVRDSDPSVEVLLVRKCGDSLAFLPWQEGGRSISRSTPDADTAMRIARQRIRLPSAMCRRWNVENTVEELTRICSSCVPLWANAPWLSGELVLILDEGLHAELAGYRLSYSSEEGLACERIE